MLNELRDSIGAYITEYADMDSWESIRLHYGIFTYMSFLCLAAYLLDKKVEPENLEQIVCRYGLEKEDVISEIFEYEGTGKFADVVLNIARKSDVTDIDHLYQFYLASDFIVVGRRVVFESGKNNRDALGAYYTQEDFACEITKKAVHDYRLEHPQSKKVRLADFSCGGGAFLVAGYKICRESGMEVELYGYDVDPVAVLISRLRIRLESDESVDTNIVLANPLLEAQVEGTYWDVFQNALKGRFYSPILGGQIRQDIDIVVGNPPWEKIRFEEKRFLHHYCPEESSSSKREREDLYHKLSEKNKAFYDVMYDDYQKSKQHIKKNKEFRLSSVGELNTYALFTELALNCLSQSGIAGLIVKTSLVKMPVYTKFFQYLVKKKYLSEIYLFVNRKKIFSIDSREEFSVIYLEKSNKKNLSVAMDIDEYKGFYEKGKINIDDVTLNRLNPDTGMFSKYKKRRGT